MTPVALSHCENTGVRVALLYGRHENYLRLRMILVLRIGQGDGSGDRSLSQGGREGAKGERSTPKVTTIW